MPDDRPFHEVGSRDLQWQHIGAVGSARWRCSYCSRDTGTDQGFLSPQGQRIRICPNCGCPTFFETPQNPSPGAPYGRPVQNLPEDVADVYEEARRCMSAAAYTAATLACRKLLMHVAVDRVEEAKPGETFARYVELLEGAGYIPPEGKGWVDYIRRSGNEANHELVVRTKVEAEGILEFAAFLLTAVYDFPARVPAPPPVEEGGGRST